MHPEEIAALFVFHEVSTMSDFPFFFFFKRGPCRLMDGLSKAIPATFWCESSEFSLRAAQESRPEFTVIEMLVYMVHKQRKELRK